MREIRTARGDAAGQDWRRQYETHAGALLRYLAKLSGDREVASDLVQETFARALRSDPLFESVAAVRPWLFRVATNLALNHARRRRLLTFLPFSGSEPAPSGAFDDTADQVRVALRAIPFDQAATLLLHYESGFARSDIAQMHGVSEETVKSRLARGRKNFIAAYRRLERGLAR